MSSVIVGWFGRSRLAIPLRAGMFAVAVLMIHPNIWSTVAGLGLLAGIYALQIALGRGHKEETRA